MHRGGRIFLFFAIFGAVFLIMFGISQGLPRAPSAVAIVALLSAYLIHEARSVQRAWMSALHEAGYVARKTFLGVNATLAHGSRTLEVVAPAVMGRGKAVVTLRARPTCVFPQTVIVAQAATGPNDATVRAVGPNAAFCDALLAPRTRDAARILLRTMGSVRHLNEIVLNEKGIEVRIIVAGDSFVEPDSAKLRLLARAAFAFADEADRATTKPAIVY